MKLLFIVLTTGIISCSGTSEKPSSNSSPGTDPKNTETINTEDPITGANSVPGTLQIFPADSKVAGSDLPTVAYDVANEITSFAQDQANYTGSLAILPPSLRLGLASDADILLGSSNGGKVAVFEEISSLAQSKGYFSSNDLVLRPGYPKIESSKIGYDLATTATTVKGSIEADRIVFNGVSLGLKSEYDLYLQNGMWRGKMKSKFQKDNIFEEFTYDYDTPILTSLEVYPIDAQGNRLTGDIVNGGVARLVLKANSNAPLNWFNYTWDGPASNLLGGGNGSSYFLKDHCPNLNAPSGFCELSRGYWVFIQDYTINAFQPSGKYTWTISVRNAAELVSRHLDTSLNVTNTGSTSVKPVLLDLAITPDANLTLGAGGQVKVEILAQSETPVNWLNRSLNGPNSNAYGGGSGMTFDECSIANPKPSLCGSNGAGYYYATFIDTFDNWRENGSYSYQDFSVQNASNLTSLPFMQARAFSISGNTVATNPVITSAHVYLVSSYGDDPLATGSLITGTCLVNSVQGSTLTAALVLNINSSNAPINWLNTSFYGPTSNLEGGGSGITATDLGGGNFRVIKYNQVSAPSFAPEGSYYFAGMSVKNAGNKTSNVVGGTSLGFNLKSTCP